MGRAGQVRGLKENAYVCAKIRWTQSCSFSSEAEALCFQTYYTLGKPITLPRQKKANSRLGPRLRVINKKAMASIVQFRKRVSCKCCLHRTWRSPGSDGGKQQVDDFPNPNPMDKEGASSSPGTPPLQWLLPSTLGNTLSDTGVLMTNHLSRAGLSNRSLGTQG